MSTFPRLKTNAVQQYPARRALEFSTSILRFVDGTEQRFREYPSLLRSWSIDLKLLDEAEMTKLENFFVTQGGQYGSFSFTDPWDQATYPNCTLQDPDLLLRYEGPQSGSLNLVVRENRD